MTSKKSKKYYISQYTTKIMNMFDYSELPIVDELITDLYVLDDIARKDLFEYIKVLKKNHIDAKRLADLKEVTIK